MAADRAAFERRRAHGIAARHAAKLRYLKEKQLLREKEETKPDVAIDELPEEAAS